MTEKEQICAEKKNPKPDEYDKAVSYSESQESLEDNDSIEVGTLSDEKDNNERKADNKHKSKIKRINEKLTDYILLIQFLASIGTVLAAIVALFTLVEMHVERNNAYRPEIVIMPNTFEGGVLNKENQEVDKKRLYIELASPYPIGCYSLSPKEGTGCLYLDRPYLTLNNIGKGTAKNVSVTFSNKWITELVTNMNNTLKRDKSNYEYKYETSYIEGYNIVTVYYRNFGEDSALDFTKDGWVAFTQSIENAENITYITSDEDSVNLALPNTFYEMLAIYYYQCLSPGKSLVTSEEKKATHYVPPVIPDLEITICYTDMQGKKYEQNEVIPFKGYAVYTAAYTMDELLESIKMSMYIYEDYLR